RSEHHLGIPAMTRSIPQLFSDFDGGKISRRQLLQALAVATVVAPAAAFAQGGAQGRGAAGDTAAGRGGRGGRGQAQRDTTPLVMPFQPTGWNTVWLDHF